MPPAVEDEGLRVELEHAMSDDVMNSSPEHEGNATGAVGEDFVEWLCEQPFGKDFLFRGQHYRGDQGDIELCDLLVLLDDTAILFEVKTALRDRKLGWNDERWADWANTRYEKAKLQLTRGCTALLTGLVKTVENTRQGCVVVDPSQIKHVFGVTVVDHPTLDKWGRGPSIAAGGREISVMTTTHEELQEVVVELSTAGDFINYLHARSAFLEKQQLFGISELDMLAHYKADPKAFLEQLKTADHIIIGDDCWDGYCVLDARRKRDELDRPAYLVDRLLDVLHESRDAKLPHIERLNVNASDSDGADQNYAVIAAELARIQRIDRRVIGKKLIEKSEKCVEQNCARWFGKQGVEGASFVFLVSPESRDERMKSLKLATWGGKFIMNAKRIIGIATEPVAGGLGFSVDAMMIDQEPSLDRKLYSEEQRNDLIAYFGTMTLVSETEFGGSESEG